MTGIGFGIARETRSTAKRWLAPIAGYFAAVFLHFTWNMAATLSGTLVLVMLPIWFLLVLGFSGVSWSGWWCAKGRIIRDHLKDEIFMGNLTQGELHHDHVVLRPLEGARSPTAAKPVAGSSTRRRASRSASGTQTARPMGGKKGTVSADFVVPLRQQLHTLRAEVSRALGRARSSSRGPGQPPQQQQQPCSTSSRNSSGVPRRDLAATAARKVGGGYGGGYGGPMTMTRFVLDSAWGDRGQSRRRVARARRASPCPTLGHRQAVRLCRKRLAPFQFDACWSSDQAARARDRGAPGRNPTTSCRST